MNKYSIMHLRYNRIIVTITAAQFEMTPCPSSKNSRWLNVHIS